MLQGSAGVAARARTLRQDMSVPEVALWTALRQRPGGLKFRRQHPSGPYVADFYCHAARLIVEVDGEAHGCGDRPQRDLRRDAWFAQRGFDVMRVRAADVLGNLDGVVRGVIARAAGGDTPPSALRPPPPLAGEE